MADTVFLIIVNSMLGLLLAILLSLVIATLAPKEYVYTETVEIYALENSNSVNGVFYLGSGGVSTNKNYYYISDYKDGKKIYSVSQNRAYIVESNETPRVEIYEERIKNPWLNKNFTLSISGREYKFIIPQDSIKYDFNVDLK